MHSLKMLFFHPSNFVCENFSFRIDKAQKNILQKKNVHTNLSHPIVEVFAYLKLVKFSAIHLEVLIC